GQYLIRAEIIALHLADKRGGVEFYGNCIQVNVKNGAGGSNFLNGVATAKFPGGYSLDDKGILVNVFNKGFKYTFPGPAVAKFSTGSASVKSTSNNNTTTITSDDDETITKTNTTSGSGKKSNTTGNIVVKSDPETSGSTKTNCRRSWASRMHKRYLGAIAAPAPVLSSE
ncbi:hypothetical protein FRC11_008971, partial [Ceratobasidium sp. 423]